VGKMTDKEFLELLMSYKAGTVPLRNVGLALANNQFGHEYIALANNILTAEKERRNGAEPEAVSKVAKEWGLILKDAPC
jgi:hypothetical protein